MDGGAGAGWFLIGGGGGGGGGGPRGAIMEGGAGAGSWFFGGRGGSGGGRVAELWLVPLQIFVPALGSSTHLPLRQMS